MQFGWGRAKPSLCGAGVCCGAAAFAAAAKLERGYACAKIMHAVWLGSSQAELVRSWCVLRCGGFRRRRQARARLGMQFGWGRAKPSCAELVSPAVRRPRPPPPSSSEARHAVWLGSSQAELVRSWCVLRCGGRRRRRQARARLGMQFGWGRAKPSLCGAGVTCGAAAFAAACQARGEATHVQKLCMQFGWGRAKPSLCGAGVCCGAAAFAALARARLRMCRNYACSLDCVGQARGRLRMCRNYACSLVGVEPSSRKGLRMCRNDAYSLVEVQPCRACAEHM